MRKLIEKYAEMENVVPEGIQLIFKGNPLTVDDTPVKLHINTDDVLEVCKVPGLHRRRSPSPKDDISEF